MPYEYRIASTHRGSSELGRCEVCDKHADEMFIQTEIHPAGFYTSAKDGGGQRFGHESCLLTIRRN